MTEKAQKLFEKFLKEYCNRGYIYSGMMLYEPGHIREYRELEELELIQKRNCEGLAYELTERERHKLITDNNLEQLWEKKASCFMVNGKFEEIEKVMKRWFTEIVKGRDDMYSPKYNKTVFVIECKLAGKMTFSVKTGKRLEWDYMLKLSSIKVGMKYQDVRNEII